MSGCEGWNGWRCTAPETKIAQFTGKLGENWVCLRLSSKTLGLADGELIAFAGRFAE